MSDLPEGLHLTYTPDQDQCGIFDAQDVCHIIFTGGGNGDPTSWEKQFIKITCGRLGVETAINEIGDEVSIDGFIDEMLGELSFNEW